MPSSGVDQREDHAHRVGMNQHNDLAGEAAVDTLIGMFQNGESGTPRHVDRE